MQTGLIRRYGKKDTVQVYIDVVIKHLGLSKKVRDIALKMFNYIAQNTSFRGLAPTMLAMTLVNLAAKKKNKHVSGSTISSYNLVSRSNRFIVFI